jgi:hypothetical protein
VAPEEGSAVATAEREREMEQLQARRAELLMAKEAGSTGL